jgi:hypothetical protein
VRVKVLQYLSSKTFRVAVTANEFEPTFQVPLNVEVLVYDVPNIFISGVQLFGKMQLLLNMPVHALPHYMGRIPEFQGGERDIPSYFGDSGSNLKQETEYLGCIFCGFRQSHHV